ncbi:hypothetical protein [Streptosporangium vulgare]|uniref:Uncharacterized protein n=1 Tax=Streptosporangium vulgare TaxID=46190 RepID=A0ABV5TAU6_9ACTN
MTVVQHLDLPPYVDDSGRQVDVLDGQAERLTLTEPERRSRLDRQHSGPIFERDTAELL